jgi:hypothetical protein
MDLRATKGVASRFAEFIEHPTEATGHADRHEPVHVSLLTSTLPGDDPVAA